MITRVLQFLLCLTACMHADAGETRFFVSTAGTLLEAELVAVAVETITLRKKEDGRELTVAKATLCKEDHAYIEAWAAQNPDQTSATVAPAASTSAGAGGKKFSLMSTIRGSKSNRGDAYFRTVVLSYAVTLQNREVSRDLNGAKGVLVSFSKDAATGDRLYAMHKVEFEINLRAQSKMEQSTPSVSLTYYQDSGNRDGVKEHGCVLIVLDSTGAVQHVDSSVPGAEKFAKEIMALTVPCVLDRNFRVNASLTLPGEIVLNP